MKIIIDYKFNGKVAGGINVFEDGRFIAVTRTSSKTYKSLKAAEKYMTALDYLKA